MYSRLCLSRIFPSFFSQLVVTRSFSPTFKVDITEHRRFFSALHTPILLTCGLLDVFWWYRCLLLRLSFSFIILSPHFVKELFLARPLFSGRDSCEQLYAIMDVLGSSFLHPHRPHSPPSPHVLLHLTIVSLSRLASATNVKFRNLPLPLLQTSRQQITSKDEVLLPPLCILLSDSQIQVAATKSVDHHVVSQNSTSTFAARFPSCSLSLFHAVSTMHLAHTFSPLLSFFCCIVTRLIRCRVLRLS